MQHRTVGSHHVSMCAERKKLASIFCTYSQLVALESSFLLTFSGEEELLPPSLLYSQFSA